jgi:N-acetylglucosamine kinase-like BadF-type ATPase
MRDMILIADSGSTKTDWCLTESNGSKAASRLSTSGTNPVFQTEEDIVRVLTDELLPQMGGQKVEAVHFYGAGCGSAERIECVRRALRLTVCTDGEVEVNSDMLAAARSLCGRSEGIACIMGTGSNSCFYDGEQIVQNVSPLGFILGDEGSGACLGKLFVGDLLKGQLGKDVCRRFGERYRLTTADIIERVYRQPFPNRFLASLSPFIRENIADEGVHRMVLGSFVAFFRRNVMHYDYSRHKVNITGSVAWHYHDILAEAARETGIELGTVSKSPMDGLMAYHTSI